MQGNKLMAAEERERLAAEVATWQLVAAVARTASVDCVIETHPGGGQYDTVHLRLAPDLENSAPVVVEVNRLGRVHVTGPDGVSRARDLIGDIRHGLPVGDAAGWILASAVCGFASETSSKVALSAEFMATAIASAVGLDDGRVWKWLNGRFDSSNAAARRDELFDAVPAADRSCSPERDDLFGFAEYRFWFLVADGLPVLGVDHRNGRVFVGEAPLSLSNPASLDLAMAAVAGPAPARAGTTPAQQAATARLAFTKVAVRLAARVADHLIPFRPGQAMTALAEWFTDASGGRLVAVVGPHEGEDVTDDVLAYALAWQGDADLVLVLPDSNVGLTLQRLPWIGTPVRVFTYGADRNPRPSVVPAVSEIVAGAAGRPLRSTDEHVLEPHEMSWVAGLVKGANDHWALVPAHRSTYLSWHCRGRQVLRVQRAGGGVRVTAGVNYSKPSPAKPRAEVVSVTAELDPVTRARVESRVAAAVLDRFSGKDQGHVEHRMQAALAASGLLQLGLTSFAREYPAWRGDGRPGYLDFLGIDRHGRLHVVETKVGTADVKGVLQTIDYAIWVAAHAKEIRAERDWPEPSRAGLEVVLLDFVLAPKATGPAVGPYFAGQVEAISGHVPWRVSVVADPLADTPVMTAYPPRTLPPPSSPLVAAPVRPARWASSVGAAMGDVL